MNDAFYQIDLTIEQFLAVAVPMCRTFSYINET